MPDPTVGVIPSVPSRSGGGGTRCGSSTARYAFRLGSMSSRTTRGPSAASPDTAPKCVARV